MDVVTEDYVPLHVQVRKRLVREISRMRVGERLPAERRLSEEFKVDRVTVRRAMADLEKEGYVIRHQGRGTFVQKTIRVGAGGTRQTRLIGFVVPDVAMVHNALVLKGVEEQATREGCEVLVCNSVLDTQREKGILERLSGYDLAGIIACPFFTDVFDPEYAELLRRIQAQGKRLVLMDTYVPTVETPVVRTDRVHMGYIATEHLIMLGHRRICYVSTGRHDPSGQGNLMGYRRALEDYEIEFDESLVIEIPIEFSAGPAHDIFKEKLEKDPRAFTAVASAQFSMTHGILRALSEMGKRVPEDIAVVGSDVLNNPDYSYVTHVSQPFHEMGLEAVKLLLRDPDDGTLKRHVQLKSKLVIGETCGAKGKIGR